jgi:hypothetical protein
MADPQTDLLYSFHNFSVFDPNTHELLYCKYSFDFDLFYNDNPGNSGPDFWKPELFSNFLGTNSIDYTTGTTIMDYNSKTTIKPELTKYFKPITQEMINYNNNYGYCIHYNKHASNFPNTFIEPIQLINQQFDMIQYTNTEINIIQDFIMEFDGKMYTKWNFDFTKYSNDFNIWGSKLLIFTDFINRIIHLVDFTIVNGIQTYITENFGPHGYILFDQFKKYFIDDPDLKEYIIDNGIISMNKSIRRNIFNIDYIEYGKRNPELSHLKRNIPQLQNHFNTYGQFEKRLVPLFPEILSEINKKKTAIGTVYTPTGVCTGFLCKYMSAFAEQTQFFLVTCFHIVDKLDDFNTIKATFQSDTKNVTAEFKMRSHDIYTDIWVGEFQPYSLYNESRNVSLSGFEYILFNDNYKLNIGDNVSTFGNIGLSDDITYLTGKVMDPAYSGSFDSTNTLSIPDTILMDMYLTPGCSGSPIFVQDLSNNKLVFAGMINGSITNKPQYSTGINVNTLASFFRTNILKPEGTPIVSAFDQTGTYLSCRTNFKKWLGIIYSYYHPQLSINKYPILYGLNWVGGLVVENFITGFDFVNEKFITNYRDLTKLNIIQIATPLLGGRMYYNFINNAKMPLVIKSATFFDGANLEYKKFTFGKFNNQDSYSKFVYGYLSSYEIYNTDPKTSNISPLLGIYNDITLEYYYFNGKEWILETEIISGNGAEKYNKYDIKISGLSYKQHTLEYPEFLFSYDKPYPEIEFGTFAK